MVVSLARPRSQSLTLEGETWSAQEPQQGVGGWGWRMTVPESRGRFVGVQSVPWAVSVDVAPVDRKWDVRRGVTVRTPGCSVANTPLVCLRCLYWKFWSAGLCGPSDPMSLAHSCPSSPSLVLEKVGEGSSADGCSELEGDGDDRDWLPLLLVSLPRTAEWLLPLLWMGLEGQSSPGCFFWMSGRGQAEGNGQKNWFKKTKNTTTTKKKESAGVKQLNQQIFQNWSRETFTEIHSCCENAVILMGVFLSNYISLGVDPRCEPAVTDPLKSTNTKRTSLSQSHSLKPPPLDGAPLIRWLATPVGVILDFRFSSPCGLTHFCIQSILSVAAAWDARLKAGTLGPRCLLVAMATAGAALHRKPVRTNQRQSWEKLRAQLEAEPFVLVGIQSVA